VNCSLPNRRIIAEAKCIKFHLSSLYWQLPITCNNYGYLATVTSLVVLKEKTTADVIHTLEDNQYV